MNATWDLRPGGSTDRAEARRVLQGLTTHPALLAVIDAWFYGELSENAYEYSQAKLAEALARENLLAFVCDVGENGGQA